MCRQWSEPTQWEELHELGTSCWVRQDWLIDFCIPRYEEKQAREESMHLNFHSNVALISSCSASGLLCHDWSQLKQSGSGRGKWKILDTNTGVDDCFVGIVLFMSFEFSFIPQSTDVKQSRRTVWLTGNCLRYCIAFVWRKTCSEDCYLWL